MSNSNPTSENRQPASDLVGGSAGTLMWWGRGDRNYSRNRIVRQAIESLGWRIVDFEPRFSRWGHVEAKLRAVMKPDLIWVPNFRQRDMQSAAITAKRWQVPLVFDPLISAYDKQVVERKKYDAASAKAQRLLKWESDLFAMADAVVADTGAHASYFHEMLRVPCDRLHVVPVGAEPGLFEASPIEIPADGKIEALFYGSLIPVQAPLVIIEAAKQCPQVQWTILGEGPLQEACVAEAKGHAHIRFEPWVKYETLPARIAQAHLLLGVFSASTKGNSVIANKVYQSLACGRPVITRRSAAYPESLVSMPSEASGMFWVPPEDSAALAECVATLAADVSRLPELGRHARATYDRFMSPDAIRQAVADLFDHCGL